MEHLGTASSAAGGGTEPATVYIVVDNAGSELALDLALSDCLLRHTSERVVLCLKAHPTFVSDATVEDVWMMLREMARRGERAAGLAERLREFWQSGRLRFLPHPYWNSSRFLWDLPPALERHFGAAQLVIIKGDANYRRTVADALWPAQTPFAQVVGYLEAPALCLRTLKSDPIVGLPSAETAVALDRVDPDLARQRPARRDSVQSSIVEEPVGSRRRVILLQPGHDFAWDEAEHQVVSLRQLRVQFVLLDVTWVDDAFQLRV